LPKFKSHFTTKWKQLLYRSGCIVASVVSRRRRRCCSRACWPSTACCCAVVRLCSHCSC